MLLVGCRDISQQLLKHLKLSSQLAIRKTNLLAFLAALLTGGEQLASFIAQKLQAIFVVLKISGRLGYQLYPGDNGVGNCDDNEGKHAIMTLLWPFPSVQ